MTVVLAWQQVEGSRSAQDAMKKLKKEMRRDIEFTIETYNASTWSRAARRLEQTDAHCVLLQEHHVADKDIAAKSTLVAKTTENRKQARKR